MSDIIPKMGLIRDFKTDKLIGVRLWGETADGCDKTRIDITLRSGDEWVITPVVGDTYWRGMSSLDMWVALQVGVRWIIEMQTYGYDCHLEAPQLRPLNTPDYAPQFPFPCDEDER